MTTTVIIIIITVIVIIIIIIIGYSTCMRFGNGIGKISKLSQPDPIGTYGDVVENHISGGGTRQCVYLVHIHSTVVASRAAVDKQGLTQCSAPEGLRVQWEYGQPPVG